MLDNDHYMMLILKILPVERFLIIIDYHKFIIFCLILQMAYNDHYKMLILKMEQVDGNNLKLGILLMIF